MNHGKIMMLQGISSAGKSTLAEALQRSLDEYWWVLEADDITYMQPTWRDNTVWQPAPGEKPHPSWNKATILERWLAGYWQCLAAIAKTGSNVIAVGGWLQPDWLFQLAKAVDGLDAYCVGVYCDLEEAERRERARGDLRHGYARSHYDVVHSHSHYDANVDTVALTTEHSVDVINSMLLSPPDERFFGRIRSGEDYRQWSNGL